MSRSGTEALAALRRRLTVAVLMALVWCSPAVADIPAGEFVLDGSVNVLTRMSNGWVYAGGAFSQQQRPTGSGLTVAATGSGTPDAATFPEVVGDVNAVVPDGAGGWYVGGSFTRIGSTNVVGLAHVTASGTVDAGFDAGAAGEVDALAIAGSTLYVGGGFGELGGATRRNLAAIDADTGRATGWSADTNDRVTALTVVGPTVYAGGWFSSVGGQSRAYLAAVDAITGTVGAFHPTIDGAVFALTANATTVFVGGQFSTVNGQPRRAFAAFDAGTGTLADFNPAPDNPVQSMTLAGRTLYIAGQFGTGGGEYTIRGFDTTSGAATGFNPGPLNGDVRALAAAGGTVFAGGWFTAADGQSRRRAAAFDASSGALRGWDPNVGGEVRALAVTGARIYIGGHFAGAGPPLARISGVVRLQPDGSLDTAWNPRVEGLVRAVVATTPTVYIAGAFSHAGGAARYALAAVDSTTGDATEWNPVPDWNLSALALSGRTLYVGGSFFRLNGQPRQFIGAVDTITAATTSWYPGPASANVNALALSGSTVYAAAPFSGLDRAGLAAFDATTGAVLPWNPAQGTAAGVDALVSAAGLIYAGGFFTTLGGFPRTRIAAIDSSGTPTPWAPQLSEVWGSVSAIAIDGTNAYLGGNFPAVGGLARANLASVDTRTGAPSSWRPTPNGSVYAVAAAGTTAIAGGDFTVAGGRVTGGLATFDLTPPRTSFIKAPGGVTNDPTPVFELGSTKPGSRFDCALNGPIYGGCAFSPFPDGTYTVTARATDRTGIEDNSPPSVTFTVDTVAPDTAANFGPPLTFSSTESGSTFRCALDAAASTPCTSPHSITGLPAGEHRLTVQAVDAAGNVDATPAELAFSVTAPVIISAPSPQPAVPTPTPTPATPIVVPVPLTVSTTAVVKVAKRKSKVVSIPFRSGYRIGDVSRRKGCRGTVTLVLRSKQAVLDKGRASLARTCRYVVTFKVSRAKLGSTKRLTVVATFHGNRYLGKVTNHIKVRLR